MRTRRTAAGLALRATRAPALLAVLLATSGCGPAPRIGAERDDEPWGGSATTFTEIRTLILEPRCATSACHSGANPVAQPRLDGAAAWDAIVDVPSSVPGYAFVTPESPDESYLLQTLLDGGAADVGGSTSLMPQGETPLDESEIEAIRAWILAGAPND